MANNIPVDIDFILKNMNFEAEAAKMKNSIKGVTSTVKTEADQMSKIFRNVAAGIGVYFSAGFLKNFVKEVASVRGEFQSLQVSLEAMLKSKAQADILMGQIVDYAMKTPLTLMEISTAAKQLIAYNFAARDVMVTMRMLGDVSSGLKIPLGDLSYLYGTLKAQGRAYLRDIFQFANRGIPIYEELAKVLHIQVNEVQDFVQAGKVGFAEVEKAFKNMTNEGGVFFGLTDKISETIPGLVSNLGDAFDKMYNGIGKANQGIIEGSLKGAIELVNNYEEYIKVLKVLITTYGAYKAATIAVAVAQKAFAFADNIRLIAMFRKELGLATAAQQAFNLSAKVNPYGLALAAITALVTILTVYNKKTDEAASVTADFSKNLSKEKTEIDNAFQAIRDAGEGTQKRADAIKLVNEQYKDYLPNQLTETSNLYEVEKAQNAVTSAVAKYLAIKAEKEHLSRSETRVDNDLITLNKHIFRATQDLTNEQQGQFMGLLDQYKKTLADQFQQLGYFPEFSVNRIGEIFKQVSGFDLSGWKLSGLDIGLRNLIRSESELDEKTKGLKTTLESYLETLGLKNTEDPPALKTVKQQIESTQKFLAEAETKLIEMRASGSEATIEQIRGQEQAIKDLKEKLTTLTGTNPKETENDKKTYASLLKDKEKEYEAYNTAVRQLGKDWADANFQLLLKDGENFRQYLDNQVELFKGSRDKMIAISAAAQSAGINLTNPITTPVTPKTIKSVGTVAPADTKTLADMTAVYKRLAAQVKLLNNEFDTEKQDQFGNSLLDTGYMFQDIAGQVSEVDAELGNFINDIAKAATNAGNLISGLASGDIFKAFSGGAGLLLAAVQALTKDNSQDSIASTLDAINKSIANTNKLLDYQLNELADKTGLSWFNAALKQVETLNSKLQTTKKDLLQIDTYVKGEAWRGKVDTSGWTPEEWLKRIESGRYSFDGMEDGVSDLLDQWINLADEIKTIENEQKLRLLGFSTDDVATSLADGIIQGFKLAEGGLGDFAQGFGDLMQAYGRKALETFINEKYLQQWYDQAYSLANDNDGITEQDKLVLQTAYREMIEGAQGFYQGISSIVGATSEQTGLAGKISAATEETMSFVGGQLMALRVDVKSIIGEIVAGQENMDASLIYLRQIELNTRDISYMKSMDTRLRDMNTYLKNLGS